MSDAEVPEFDPDPLKIDMAHPNIVMRDPVVYRIRHTDHHRTGNKWCIYPLYDFTHCISDALENVSHSICTLEFENNRPLYDWIVNSLKELGVFKDPVPHQYEFARLNLTYTITSKRKLAQLVNEGKQPRAMLEYTGCLTHGLIKMGAGDVIESLRRVLAQDSPN